MRRFVRPMVWGSPPGGRGGFEDDERGAWIARGLGGSRWIIAFCGGV